MAEMEKSLRYYEEGDSEGRKVSRSVPIVSYIQCLLLSTVLSLPPPLNLWTPGGLYCLAVHTGFQSHTMTVLTEHTHSAGESLN